MQFIYHPHTQDVVHCTKHVKTHQLRHHHIFYVIHTHRDVVHCTQHVTHELKKPPYISHILRTHTRVDTTYVYTNTHPPTHPPTHTPSINLDVTVRFVKRSEQLVRGGGVEEEEE
jgi:hypothetical protein